jgi:hypothetical protein
MASRGRPRVLDEMKQREVCALVSAGFNLAGAARYVNCSANTIRRHAERDPAFREQLRKCQLSAKLEPLQALRAKAGTHWRAAAWMLRHLDPEQFADYDSKLLKPEEVGDLLSNIKQTLERIVRDPADNFIACGIVEAAREQLNLPAGRRNVYAKLNQLPIPGLPGRFDDLRKTWGLPPVGEAGDEDPMDQEQALESGG